MQASVPSSSSGRTSGRLQQRALQQPRAALRTPARAGVRAGQRSVFTAPAGPMGRIPTAHRRASTRLSAVVTDVATSLTFPDVVQGLKCLGAGVREKKIAFINVKVYSVALYVDAAAAAAALKGGATLLSGDFDKLLSIKLARKVDGPTFWGALNDAVMPRIAQIATDQATAEDADGNFMSSVAEAAEVAEAAATAGAKALGSFLSGQSLDTGAEVVLRWSPGGVLCASVSGGPEQKYESKELCQALFDVYLGSDPVSPAAAGAWSAAAKAL